MKNLSDVFVEGVLAGLEKTAAPAQAAPKSFMDGVNEALEKSASPYTKSELNSMGGKSSLKSKISGAAKWVGNKAKAGWGNKKVRYGVGGAMAAAGAAYGGRKLYKKLKAKKAQK